MSTMGRSFRLLAAVLGSLGLVISIVENFRHLNVLLEEKFWVVLTVSFVLSIVAIWPKSAHQRTVGFRDVEKHATISILKYRWVFVLTLIFLGAGFYRYYLVNKREPGSAPVVKPGDIPLEPSSSLSIISSSYAQTPQPRPKLVGFKLRAEKTLYVETSQSGQKMYALSADLLGLIKKGGCTKDFDSHSALISLRAYAQQNSKERVLKYIETEEELESLVANHPQIAKDLMPSKLEWSKFSRADYFAVLNWVRNCVGIQFPVFIVTIENPSDRDLLVTNINYQVLNITGTPPTNGPPQSAGALVPTANYTYELSDKVGVQSQDLSPVFRVPPKSSGAFELQLDAKDKEDYGSQTFTLKIEFVTNQSSVSTDKFLLKFVKGRPH
jgi:hypothetical protein